MAMMAMTTSNSIRSEDITSNGNLVEIALTLRQLCLAFGRRQGWQKERRQNGDDGDDDEQFNQCKASWSFHMHGFFGNQSRLTHLSICKPSDVYPSIGSYFGSRQNWRESSEAVRL